MANFFLFVIFDHIDALKIRVVLLIDHTDHFGLDVKVRVPLEENYSMLERVYRGMRS